MVIKWRLIDIDDYVVKRINNGVWLVIVEPGT